MGSRAMSYHRVKLQLWNNTKNLPPDWKIWQTNAINGLFSPVRCVWYVCVRTFSFSSSLSNTYWHIKRRQNWVYVSAWLLLVCRLKILPFSSKRSILSTQHLLLLLCICIDCTLWVRVCCVNFIHLCYAFCLPLVFNCPDKGKQYSTCVCV